MTNFEKVKEFNRAFEMRINETPSRNIFTEDPDNVKLALSLITEEVKELQDAVQQHDFGEVRDAISDILYVVYGMADRFGINADSDFDEVHSSNMSKLCNSEEEAKLTVKEYEKRYKAGTSPYDTPQYTYLENIGKWVVKNMSTGKVLKSINYTKVKFD